jgi:hypothetical protein
MTERTNFMTIGRYRIHPAAEIFPMMSDGELQELAEDIKKNGLVHPIIIHDGAILDGRNRFAACQKACVAPKFADWTGTGSPTSWVLSVNFHRRHLTASQRATIATQALPILEAEAKERQRIAGGDKKSDKAKSVVEIIPPAIAEGKARDIAAAAAQVNARYVSDAKAIKEKSPETFEKVKNGELTIPQAKKIVSEKEASKDSNKIWDVGGFVERPAKHKPEDDDSDGLWHLKNCWRKANKKEKTAFLNWVEESGFQSKRKK